MKEINLHYFISENGRELECLVGKSIGVKISGINPPEPMIFMGVFGEIDKEYEFVRDIRYGELADDWFYIDLNFEKYFRLGRTTVSLFIEVNNLLDTQNSNIINPVTGRAYEYGDDVPSSWNDPRFPDVQAPISPFPDNPARYLSRRNIKFGVSFKF